MRQGLPLQRHRQPASAPARTPARLKPSAWTRQQALPTSTTRPASPAAPASTMCPFGAIVDKSLYPGRASGHAARRATTTRTTSVYAVVAPSISSQFSYAKLGQVITGIKELGFFQRGRGRLGRGYGILCTRLPSWPKRASSPAPAARPLWTTSRSEFPQLKEHVSHNLSPAATIAKYIKETDARRQGCLYRALHRQEDGSAEASASSPTSTACITFEELQALFDSRDIDFEVLRGGRAGQRLLLRPHLRPQRRLQRRRGPGRSRSRAWTRLSSRKAIALRRHRGLPHGAARRLAKKRAARQLHRGHGLHRRLHWRRRLLDPRSTRTRPTWTSYGMEAMEKTITDAIGVLKK